MQHLRLRAVSIVNQSTTARHSQYPTSFLRTNPFHSSSLFAASEAPRSPFEAPYSEAAVPLYDRLQAHPEALAAIEDLARLAKAKTGVDLSSGDKPSLSMMRQLADDPDLKRAAERLMKGLKDAGITIDPKQAFEALKTMGGEGFEGVGGFEAASGRGFRGEGEDEGGEGSKK